jgi:hypothetical protein
VGAISESYRQSLKFEYNFHLCKVSGFHLFYLILRCMLVTDHDYQCGSGGCGHRKTSGKKPGLRCSSAWISGVGNGGIVGVGLTYAPPRPFETSPLVAEPSVR